MALHLAPRPEYVSLPWLSGRRLGAMIAIAALLLSGIVCIGAAIGSPCILAGLQDAAIT